MSCEDGFIEVPNTDGHLKKKILREGTGDATPAKGNMVSVHYTGTLTTDGSKFDSSRDRAGTFEFQVGVGQVIKGWDEGIVTMKKGELCILRCSSEYGYGAHGSPPKIPGGASLDFEVELFKWWEKEKEPWEMSPGEKMATATKAKAEGNESFKAGEYLAALENYEKGLKLVKDLAQGEEEEELVGDQLYKDTTQGKEATALCLSLALNCAMARLKANVGYKDAISNCELALSLDSQNVKALFRMAQAYHKDGEYDTAKEKLQALLQVDPDNAEAAAEIKRVEAAAIKAKKAEKAMYGKMFG